MKYMNECRTAQKKISEEQSAKIIKVIEKDPQKYMNSEIYKNQLLDRKLKKD